MHTNRSVNCQYFPPFPEKKRIRRSEAFLVNTFLKGFVGFQPVTNVNKHQAFGNELCLHHQDEMHFISESLIIIAVCNVLETRETFFKEQNSYVLKDSV